MGAIPLVPGRFIPARAGETEEARRRLAYACGSSPRVRGRRSRRRRPHGRPTVHPRACGGDTPAVEGKAGQHRFIPARAGETALSTAARDPVSGSSPRVRGRLFASLQAPVLGTVHPRACGGDLEPRQRRGVELGSSPRVRGDSSAARGRGGAAGSSPRVRGRRVCGSSHDAGEPVHPRACGGDERDRVNLKLDTRFIPARAGETLRKDKGKCSRTGRKCVTRMEDQTLTASIGTVRFNP